MKRKVKLVPDSVLFGMLLTFSIILLASFFSSLFGDSQRVEVAVVSEEDAPPTVILDAGHGGLDSGAVSVYGDEEKHLNLEVAKKLGAIPVVFTFKGDLKKAIGNTATKCVFTYKETLQCIFYNQTHKNNAIYPPVFREYVCFKIITVHKHL